MQHNPFLNLHFDHDTRWPLRKIFATADSIVWQQTLCSLSFMGYKTAVLENKRRTGTEKAKSSLHLAWLVLCLSSPSASLQALQYGGFVSREWLDAKGLLRCKEAVDPKHAEPSQGYLVCATLQTVVPILSLFPLRVGTFIVQFSAILLRNLPEGVAKEEYNYPEYWESKYSYIPSTPVPTHLIHLRLLLVLILSAMLTCPVLIVSYPEFGLTLSGRKSL